MTSLHVHGLSLVFIVLGTVLAAFVPVPTYWHQKGHVERRDAALIIPWALLIAFTVPIPFLVGARLLLPLCDNAFAAIDRALGVSGPDIVAWAQRYAIGHAINWSYRLLFPYFAVAASISSLSGKREAKQFLLANLIAIGLGVICFTLFPAIGPWTSEHFAASAQQLTIQKQVLTLRNPRPYLFSLISDGSGIVSFPSFHVIWSVFAASALWGFQRLRLLVVIFSAAIIASTLTTGWHYGIDVLGGLAISALSLFLANAWLNPDQAINVYDPPPDELGSGMTMENA
jgi:membrane-associated phospholipid phosphatase